MSIKKGTKLTDNPKNLTIKIRMDKNTMNQLDECVKALSSNRSEVIRTSIKKMHDELNEKN